MSLHVANRSFAALISACVLTLSSHAYCQDITAEEAQERAAIADNLKKEAEAKLAALKAHREYDALTSGNSVTDQKSQQELQKAIADSQKAQADAEKSTLDTQLAIEKAKYGTIANNTATAGSVTAGTGAGSTEASLISAKEIDELGGKIAAAIQAASPQGHGLAAVRHTIIIAPDSGSVSFADITAFEFKRDLLATALLSTSDQLKTAQQLEAALGNGPKVKGPKSRIGTLGSITTAAGSLLNSSAGAATYFQNTYTFSALTTAGVDDDLLVRSIINRLPADVNVFSPGNFLPLNTADFQNEIANLNTGRQSSLVLQAIAKARTALLNERLKNEKDEDQKKKIQDVIVAYETVAATSQLLQKNYDDFITSLMASDTNGATVVYKIAMQKFFRDKMSSGAMIVAVKVNATGGTGYTKQNLWSFFGSTPFYVMGGAVVSYRLIGSDGRVLAAGQFQGHGGYQSVSKVKENLRKH